MSDLCACGHGSEAHYGGKGCCLAHRCLCLHWRRPPIRCGIENVAGEVAPASSAAKTMRPQVRTSLDFPAGCEMACDHSCDQTAPLVPLIRERNRTSAPTPLPGQHEVASPLTCYFVASEDVRQPNWQPRDQRTALARLCTTYPDQHIRPTWSSTWSSTGPVGGASSLVRVDKGRLSPERSAWISRLTTKIPLRMTGLISSSPSPVPIEKGAAKCSVIRPATSASVLANDPIPPSGALKSLAAGLSRSASKRFTAIAARIAAPGITATTARHGGVGPMPRSRSSLGGGRAKSHRRGRVTPPPGTLREAAAAARKATWWEARLAAIDVPSQHQPRKDNHS
jgi:hypothetical protein